jgi:hypothetical protein
VLARFVLARTSGVTTTLRATDETASLHERASQALVLARAADETASEAPVLARAADQTASGGDTRGSDAGLIRVMDSLFMTSSAASPRGVRARVLVAAPGVAAKDDVEERHADHWSTNDSWHRRVLAHAARARSRWRCLTREESTAYVFFCLTGCAQHARWSSRNA